MLLQEACECLELLERKDFASRIVGAVENDGFGFGRNQTFNLVDRQLKLSLRLQIHRNRNSSVEQNNRLIEKPRRTQKYDFVPFVNKTSHGCRQTRKSACGHDHIIGAIGRELVLIDEL